MTWLSPEDVAERLKISRRSALVIMQKIPHVSVSGSIRLRLRVTETDLNNYLLGSVSGKTKVSVPAAGSKRKLARKGV